MKRGGHFNDLTSLFERPFEQVFSISKLTCAKLTIDFDSPIEVRISWFPSHGTLTGKWIILSDIASGNGAVLDEAWEVFCGLAEDELTDAASIVQQLQSTKPPYEGVTDEMAQRAVALMKRVKSVSRNVA